MKLVILEPVKLVILERIFNARRYWIGKGHRPIAIILREDAFGPLNASSGGRIFGMEILAPSHGTRSYFQILTQEMVAEKAIDLEAWRYHGTIC